MKPSALRNKSVAELQQELLSLRREQFALRLQRATGQMPKPDQFGKVRKNIARALTVQAQVRAAGVGAGFAAAAARVASAEGPISESSGPAEEAKPARAKGKSIRARIAAAARGRSSKRKAGEA